MMDAGCKDGKKTQLLLGLTSSSSGSPWASLADCEVVGGYGKSPALLVVATDTA